MSDEMKKKDVADSVPGSSKPPGDIDYNESNNVSHIHEQIKREQNDPDQGAEPIPLMGIAFVMLILALGFMYFGMFSAGFKSDGYDERGGSVASSAAAGGAVEEDPMVVMIRSGKRNFKTYCQSCHQATGNGVAGQYPPLVGSRWVLENEERLAAIILGGLQGEIEVKGNIYNGNMAAWGQTLNDQKVAEILTYIRQEWGNAAPPVAAELVAKVREEHHTADRSEAWTATELESTFGK
jgi:mono/diheme cytochrome c family protein